MRKIRVGVHLNPQHGDYADYKRAVLEVEKTGADVITVWDHFYPSPVIPMANTTSAGRS